MMVGLRVLGIFPHPDDEAYSCGGTIAQMAREGAEVHVLCATDGDAGKDRRQMLTEAGTLDITRRNELVCSCRKLGAAPPRFLGIVDGTIEQVHFPEVVGEIVRVIRAIRPHILLSLGPDGVYGHPDHIALFRLVVASFASATGGERFSADVYGANWTPQRLFLAAFPKGMFRPMFDHMLESEYAAAIRAFDPDKLGVEPQEVAAAVDIRAYAGEKLAAIACHLSQLRDGDPLRLFPADLVQRTLTTELFTLGAGRPVTSRLRSLDQDLEL